MYTNAAIEKELAQVFESDNDSQIAICSFKNLPASVGTVRTLVVCEAMSNILCTPAAMELSNLFLNDNAALVANTSSETSRLVARRLRMAYEEEFKACSMWILFVNDLDLNWIQGRSVPNS
jgi:hypothetical protein